MDFGQKVSLKIVDFSVDFFLLIFPRKMTRKNLPRNPPRKPNTKIHQKFQGRGAPEEFRDFGDPRDSSSEKTPFVMTPVSVPEVLRPSDICDPHPSWSAASISRCSHITLLRLQETWLSHFVTIGVVILVALKRPRLIQH